jgi:hypothetical protein
LSPDLAGQAKWSDAAQGETRTLPPDAGQMVRELTVTPAGQQPVTIVYRIDNRRGKRVGANQHTEPVAAAQAGNEDGANRCRDQSWIFTPDNRERIQG